MRRLQTIVSLGSGLFLYLSSLSVAVLLASWVNGGEWATTPERAGAAVFVVGKILLTPYGIC